MSSGKTIAVQPRGSGGLTFYAAALYPEDWIKTSGIDFNDPGHVYTYLVNYYKGWSPIFFKLFKACKQFVPRPLNLFSFRSALGYKSKPHDYWRCCAFDASIGRRCEYIHAGGFRFK